MTPEERAREAIWRDIPSSCSTVNHHWLNGRIDAVAGAIRAAVAEVEQKFDEYSEWLRITAAQNTVDAIAEEREACATLADRVVESFDYQHEGARASAAEEIAATIRARGQHA